MAVAAVFAFSPAAVLVRLSSGISPSETACLRLALAALLLGLLARAQNTSLRPGPGECPLLALLAFITALHFTCFNAAIARTSIANSLALTYTAPVFAALLAQVFLDETLSPRQWIGILIVVASVALLCTTFSSVDADSIGDALALLSGLALGTYHFLGRALRRRIPLLRYAFWLYAGAALYLLLPAWPFSSIYTTTAVVAIIIQGCICTGLGHTLTNAALRRAPTALVSLIVTQEVTGGVIIGAITLGDWPDKLSTTAIIPMMIGLALVLRFGDRKESTAEK